MKRGSDNVWKMLQTETVYNDPGKDDYCIKRHRDRAKKRALDESRNLGCTVTLEPISEVV